jgi:sugar phosphate isomerase/epimerase
MRLSISNIAWEPDQDRAVADIMRACGVDALEVAPSRYWDIPGSVTQCEIQAVRCRWRDWGIQIVAMQALLFGVRSFNVFGDRDHRRQMMAHLDGIIRVGSGLGARYLVFGAPKSRDRHGMSDSQAHDIAVEFFGDLARRAYAQDAIIGLEPNPVAYGCNFATTAKEARVIVESVSHPGLQLHLDSGIMYLNKELAPDPVHEHAEALIHFHISEPFLAPVGAGPVEHTAWGAALRDVCYDGFVSIEMRSAVNSIISLANVQTALMVCKKAYLEK